jgi:hypothetical protein
MAEIIEFLEAKISPHLDVWILFYIVLASDNISGIDENWD